MITNLSSSVTEPEPAPAPVVGDLTEGNCRFFILVQKKNFVVESLLFYWSLSRQKKPGAGKILTDLGKTKLVVGTSIL